LSLKAQHYGMDGFFEPSYGIGRLYSIQASLEAGNDQRVSIAGRQRVRPLLVDAEKLSDGHDFGRRPAKKTKRSRAPEDCKSSSPPHVIFNLAHKIFRLGEHFHLF
jgi:hypothetical protein